MFPGQPLSYPEFPVQDPVFDSIVSLCAATTGFDLLNPVGAHGSSQLSSSVKLQLCGVAMSLYHLNRRKLSGEMPDLVCEHSLGIYAALAACGSLDDSAALELAGRIGTRIAQFGEGCNYAFGSVVGLTEAPLAAIAQNNAVFIVNFNTSRHFLMCGKRESIDCAVAEAQSAGAFSVTVFACDAPLHTPFIEEIVGDLEQIVREFKYFSPRVPLVDHLAQRQLKAADIPLFLVDELCRPVYWDKTFRSIRNMGVNAFVEVGAGQSLTKFNRWIDSET